MRELEQRRDLAELETHAAHEPEIEQRHTQFRTSGELPPVSNHFDYGHERSPGSLAFGEDSQASETRAAERKAPSWQTRTLKGRYGTYVVQYTFVHLTDTNRNAMKLTIRMEPNDKKVSSEQIGFLQVVRRSEDGGKTSATKQSHFMSAKRVQRTDEKTGFRVDRGDRASTPFYGTQKDKQGNIATNDGTTIGVHGANAQMTDRPQVDPFQHLEFISTATDMQTGAQFDAVRWGFQADEHNVTAIEPEILEATDARLVGRDRAIHKWNEIADTGVDSVPVDYDPTDVAGMLHALVDSKQTDALRMTLSSPLNQNAEHRARVKANYEVETGRSLAKDLKAVLNSHDQHLLKEWL